MILWLKMVNLEQYDFNRLSGWAAVLLVSIGVSTVIFAAVYLTEGLSWLAAYEEESIDTYKKVGQNWVRGAGIALVSSLTLFFVSRLMLKHNKTCTVKRPILWGRLDFNNPKCTLALVLFAVSFTFFANAALYRYEYTMWALSGIATATTWYLEEASAWATAAMYMALIGTALTVSAWLLIVAGWRKNKG